MFLRRRDVETACTDHVQAMQHMLSLMDSQLINHQTLDSRLIMQIARRLIQLLEIVPRKIEHLTMVHFASATLCNIISTVKATAIEHADQLSCLRTWIVDSPDALTMLAFQSMDKATGQNSAQILAFLALSQDDLSDMQRRSHSVMWQNLRRAGWLFPGHWNHRIERGDWSLQEVHHAAVDAQIIPKTVTEWIIYVENRGFAITGGNRAEKGCGSRHSPHSLRFIDATGVAAENGTPVRLRRKTNGKCPWLIAPKVRGDTDSAAGVWSHCYSDGASVDDVYSWLQRQGGACRKYADMFLYHGIDGVALHQLAETLQSTAAVQSVWINVWVKLVSHQDLKQFHLRIQQLFADLQKQEFKPVHRYAYEGDLTGVQSEIERLPQLLNDATPTTKDTCLHLACEFGHVDVIKYLIGHNQIRYTENSRSLRPLDLAKLHQDLNDDSKTLLTVLNAFKESKIPAVREICQSEEQRIEQRPNVPSSEAFVISLSRLNAGGDQKNWQQLSAGMYGDVWQIDRVFPPIYQVNSKKKQVSKRHDTVIVKSSKVGAESELKGEIETLAALQHQHVVSILGMAHAPRDTTDVHGWLLLLELCDAKDMANLIHKTNVLDWQVEQGCHICFELAFQIADGLEYIHSNDVKEQLNRDGMHLDLKPANILLQHRSLDEGSNMCPYIAKIADFGISDESESYPYGTHGYMSPECWGGDSQTLESLEAYKSQYGQPCQNSDVFSYGLILWEMYSRKHVHSGFEGFDPDLGHNVEQVTQWMTEQQARPAIPSTCPAVWALLIRSCWAQSQDKRPSAAEIVEILKNVRHIDTNVWSATTPEPKGSSSPASAKQWLKTLQFELSSEEQKLGTEIMNMAPERTNEPELEEHAADKAWSDMTVEEQAPKPEPEPEPEPERISDVLYMKLAVTYMQYQSPPTAITTKFDAIVEKLRKDGSCWSFIEEVYKIVKTTFPAPTIARVWLDALGYLSMEQVDTAVAYTQEQGEPTALKDMDLDDFDEMVEEMVLDDTLQQRFRAAVQAIKPQHSPVVAQCDCRSELKRLVEVLSCIKTKYEELTKHEKLVDANLNAYLNSSTIEKLVRKAAPFVDHPKVSNVLGDLLLLRVRAGSRLLDAGGVGGWGVSPMGHVFNIVGALIGFGGEGLDIGCSDAELEHTFEEELESIEDHAAALVGALFRWTGTLKAHAQAREVEGDTEMGGSHRGTLSARGIPAAGAGMGIEDEYGYSKALLHRPQHQNDALHSTSAWERFTQHSRGADWVRRRGLRYRMFGR
eukprot:COSAG05_NODE_714_length_7813_cov_41.624060_2_plen_1268_part_00